MLRMKEEGLEIVNDFVDQCKRRRRNLLRMCKQNMPQI